MKKSLNNVVRTLILFSLVAGMVGGCSSKAEKKRELGARRTATAALLKLGCPFGTNLNKENLDLLLRHVDEKGVLASYSYDQAARDFSHFKGWYRVLIATNLANLEYLAQQAEDDGTPYEALGYSPDQGNNAIASEISNLLSSTQKARAIAKHYGKLLVMLPG